MAAKVESLFKKAQGQAPKHEIDSLAMLKVNGLYRGRIKSLLKDLKAFDDKRKELEEKYSSLRKEVFKLK